MNRLLPLLALLTACPEEQVEETDTPPGTFQAGVAVREVSAPVGIPVAGYGNFGAADDGSPLAEVYPSTHRVWAPTQARVLVLSRGTGHELVFVRTDTVGVFQHLRQGLLEELEARTGEDMDQYLHWGGTHTHGGPARFVDRDGLWELVADRFLPDHYLRFIGDVADAVEDAYADLADAELATVTASCSDAHSDRRCEDGILYENPDTPVIVVRRDGEIDALMLAYAVHGVSVPRDALTITRDVSGAIESHIEDRLTGEPVAIFFNSWAGDMSIDSLAETREGSDMPDGYDNAEAAGWTVAESVMLALEDAEYTTEPELDSAVHRVALNREALDYPDEEFEYEWGALFCGESLDQPECSSEDYEPARIEEMDEACIPIPEESPPPMVTPLGVGRVGDFTFVTWPGEPVTLLGEATTDAVAAITGTDVMFLGYTNDYTGYAVAEEEWWYGGYEASGTIWGPKQGDYIKDEIVDFAGDWYAGTLPSDSATMLPRVLPFQIGDYDAFEAQTALSVGTELTPVEDSYGALESVTWTFAGCDPWVGSPLVRLETSAGEPVLRASGHPVDSTGQAFWLELTFDPTYDEDDETTERMFLWEFNLPLTHSVPDAILPSLVGGSYRLVAEIPNEDGSTTELVSGTFSVSATSDTGR